MLQIISYFLRGYGYTTSSLPIGDLKYLPQPIIILIKVFYGYIEIDGQKGKRSYSSYMVDTANINSFQHLLHAILHFCQVLVCLNKQSQYYRGLMSFLPFYKCQHSEQLKYTCSYKNYKH